MNTPETIDIEKYAEALNNLVGMDIGYLGDSDENVNAIVEVIRAAKALENIVFELTEENDRLKAQVDVWMSTAYCEKDRVDSIKRDTVCQLKSALKDAFEDLEYNANTKRKTVRVEELGGQMNWLLHEVAPQRIEEVLNKFLEGKVNV